MVEFLSQQRLRARRSSKWSTFADDVLPSNPAEMDFAAAPAIQNALVDLVEDQRYGYPLRTQDGPMAKVAELFRSRMSRRFGWQVETESTLVLNDVVQALAAVVTAFSEPGEGVLTQVPSYPAFLIAIDECGRRAILNPMVDIGTRFEIDSAQLRASLPADLRILLLCSPHNPTGRVFSHGELLPLAELAAERNLVVISDEIHSDLVFDGRQHMPFARLFPDLADQTITLYSATKTFNIPGLRCAIMQFGSARLRKQFHARVPGLVLGQPGVPGMMATIAAWEYGEGWFDEVLGILESNRDHLLGRFADELPDVRIYRPEATYLAWADFAGMNLPRRPFETLLETAKVAGGDGRGFGPHYESCVRFNFATSLSILDEKIDRIVGFTRAPKESSFGM